MIREVNLQSYLPLFMREYQEIAATLDAENPEFRLVWDAANRVLYNEFIATADEYGISRFEKILGILPYQEDTLESRRSRVFSQWFNEIPYTMKVLVARLITICGEGNFTIEPDFMRYTLVINTELEMFGQVEELERLLESMIPCNMIVISNNELLYEIYGKALIAMGLCVSRFFVITNDMNVHPIIEGKANIGGGIAYAESHILTNDFKSDEDIESPFMLAGGVVNTVAVIITNDFQDETTIETQNTLRSGVVSAEFFEIN